MSLLIYTSITETKSQAWIMRAAREGFMSVWHTCGERFVTLRGFIWEQARDSVFLFRYCCIFGYSCCPVPLHMGKKSWHENTSSHNMHYHNKLSLSLSAPDVAVFGSTPGGYRQLQARWGWATAEQQDQKYVKLWLEMFFSVSFNRDNAGMALGRPSTIIALERHWLHQQVSILLD